MKLKSRVQIGGLLFLALLLVNLTGSFSHAHKVDEIKRIAIVSAFLPEMKLLSSELENPAQTLDQRSDLSCWDLGRQGSCIVFVRHKRCQCCHDRAARSDTI